MKNLSKLFMIILLIISACSTQKDITLKGEKIQTPCNGQVVAGELSSGQTHTTKIYLGTETGKVKIDFNVLNCPDKMEVIYNGSVIKNTEFIQNGSSFSFDYSPVENVYYVVVKITGGDDCSPTTWEYTVGCPN